MLLYESDWEKYPSAIVDYRTKNESFLHYSLLLKAMGVKNNLWPLTLIHPELQGINPFSEDLTFEQKLLITMEAKANPFYYFREIARAPGSTIATPMIFRANRSNMALLWLYFNHITVCLVQLRQTGKTFTITSLDAYLLNIRSKGGRTLLLTKDEGLRAKTLTEIATIEELLPSWLKHHNKLDVGNKEEINVSSLDNNYKGLIARNDPVAADKTGRGHTVENVRVDEAAYLFFIEIAMSVMLAATTAARASADQRDIPYGNIFTTTAGKLDDRDGAYMHKYFNDGAPFNDFFFDSKNHEELRKMVQSGSRDGKVLRVHATFNHRQLGYTDQWLSEVAAENNSYGEQFDRDYLNHWTSGGQSSPFDIDTKKRLRASQREVLFGEISRYGGIMMRWYIKEEDIERVMNTHHTVIAVDTSDGMGRDEFSIMIRNLKTGAVLAVTSVNAINLITVANYLVDLLKRFLKSTMIIERRNQAPALIDYMHQQMLSINMDPFTRMYNTVVQDHIEFHERFKEIQSNRNSSDEHFLARMKKFFGFATSGGGVTSRTELYGSTLQATAKYTGDSIGDKQTIDQLLALITKNGRVDHPSGGHDDLVVAWLLSYWFMVFGKNLQYYGIPAGYIFSNNMVVHSSTNKEEVYQNEITKRARDHIQQRLEYIKTEKDPNIVERIIMEIENIKNFLGPQHEVSISADEMINNIKKEKRYAGYNKRSIF